MSKEAEAAIAAYAEDCEMFLEMQKAGFSF